ncbi:hypothetical protein M8542_45980 [Amycolatopsis sp. OK19-0408]|uniref:Uncharacterized protein n=1 Tax=Amycolatopsis iheyensis TaxID=2945988 RepID=A0A9X2NK30_9PSEU|nr:hypothetical protein [Amycolatopsis iheyensis]MCR6490184.1 hypothetical protein [Amycolatopsis iheyensis]
MDSLLEGPRRALYRARRDSSTWPEFAFDAGPAGDRNASARYGLLLALQYDRRPGDLPLLRFVLRQQIDWYRELVANYFPTVFFLAGLLVAEHRRVEDVWLHWEAKELSFDAALGYRDQLLLTPGIAAVREATASDDRLSAHLARVRWTDADVDAWLAD